MRASLIHRTLSMKVRRSQSLTIVVMQVSRIHQILSITGRDNQPLIIVVMIVSRTHQISIIPIVINANAYYWVEDVSATQ